MSKTYKDKKPKKWKTGPHSCKRTYQKVSVRKIRREAKKVLIDPTKEENFLNPINLHNIYMNYYW